MPVIQRSELQADQYRFIFDHAPAMVAYLDRNARFQFVNEKYCTLHQTSEDQIIGRTIDDLLDDRLAALIKPRIRAVLKGAEQRFEIKTWNKRGEERWVQAYYVPDTGPGKTTRGFFAFIQDIHERKLTEQSRARLQYAVDQGVEGFALLDDAGNYTYMNPAHAAIYGYEPAEVLGQSWKLLYEEDQIDRIENSLFPQLIREGKWQGELIGRKKAGERVDVEVSLALLVDEAGNPSGLVCNCQDITQRKIAEESLRQLQKMDAVGQLTGGIAHDFNNLLAPIVGYLELLHDQVGHLPDAEALIDRAQSAAERGANLTHRLLAFSRKQPLRPRPLDLNDLVLGMDDLLRRTLGEGIEITIDREASIWTCEADPPQLENAILNLALNARDAMPNGGKLTIRTRNITAGRDGDGCKADGEEVMLSISDTGMGMSAEVKEKIFEPFFTTKEFGKGSGLGLSMVHGFVAQSGGRLEVMSALGEGTTFDIYLPRSQSNVTDLGKQKKADPIRGRAETVLLVEDDPDVLEMARAMLKGLGYKVVEASDGPEALEKLASQADIDLLLSDVVLPGGFDGRELARRIKATNPEIKAVFMSGYTAEITDFDTDIPLIRKPFTLSSLSEKLGEALSQGPSAKNQ